MDALLEEYRMTKSKSAYAKIVELVAKSDDARGIKALAAYTVIHKRDDFGSLIVERLNSGHGEEAMVEKLIEVLDLSGLVMWPRARQRVKYRMHKGLQLDAADMEYFASADNRDEAYFSRYFGLCTLLKYRNALESFDLYRMIVGRKLIESVDYWEDFISFPFLSVPGSDDSQSITGYINMLYFDIKKAEDLYSAYMRVSQRSELIRFYFILSAVKAKYPAWRRHFEWFLFKSSLLLAYSYDYTGIEHWDFIFDRIEKDITKDNLAQGPLLLEAALSNCNMPFMVSSFQPIIVDFIKRRIRQEEYYVLPLLRMLHIDATQESLMNALVNYVSHDALSVRQTTLKVLLGAMRKMGSMERLPFVARIWDLLEKRKDATVKYLKDLLELEGDFLESRIAKLPLEKKKYCI
jgi:hypothetical protein